MRATDAASCGNWGLGFREYERLSAIKAGHGTTHLRYVVSTRAGVILYGGVSMCVEGCVSTVDDAKLIPERRSRAVLELGLRSRRA